MYVTGSLNLLKFEIQWGTKLLTSPVFKWFKPVRSLNGLVFKWHLNSIGYWNGILIPDTHSKKYQRNKNTTPIDNLLFLREDSDFGS